MKFTRLLLENQSVACAKLSAACHPEPPRRRISQPKLMASRFYYVYIMTGSGWSLYTGVTNNLPRRALKHKNKTLPGFTARYNLTILVYYEEFAGIRAAIAREKEIKSWTRAKKKALVELKNPEWKDLRDGWPK
jgi:putative endonuclease